MPRATRFDSTTPCVATEIDAMDDDKTISADRISCAANNVKARKHHFHTLASINTESAGRYLSTR